MVAKLLKRGRLVPNSLHDTKTAAGDFAQGYRSARFGKQAKPRGSIRVQPVRNKWGVFDYNPVKRRG